MTIYYVGTAAEAAQYLGPYNAIGPVSVQNDSIPYPEVAEATGTGSGDPLCQFGNSHVQFPVGLLTYNVTTNRQIYDFFKDVTVETPAFNGSYIVFEGYSLEGMKAVDPDSTAFPHRADNILVYVPAPSTIPLFFFLSLSEPPHGPGEGEESKRRPLTDPPPGTHQSPTYPMPRWTTRPSRGASRWRKCSTTATSRAAGRMPMSIMPLATSRLSRFMGTSRGGSRG